MHLYPNKNTTDNLSKLKKEFASENSEDKTILYYYIAKTSHSRFSPHGHKRLFLKYVAKQSSLAAQC